MTGAGPEPLWYAAYGSNLSRARLQHYLTGGRPPGSRRDYPGCRDSSPPASIRTVSLTGTLRFGGESGAWGGGMAFFVPGASGVVHARAYLLQHAQLGDLVAQEARRPVGGPWALSPSGPTRHGLSEVYDVVLDLGLLDGHRLVTLTTTGRHAPNPPAPAYVRTMLDGLADGFGLDLDARVAYLASADGMAPRWTADRLRVLAPGSVAG